MKLLLDWYFNTDKFTYGSRVNKYKNRYIITIGFDKAYFGDTFNEAIIKTTDNKLLKFIFRFVRLKVEKRYFRNMFSGSKYKKKWKKLYGCTHLAWEIGGSFNKEHKHITKIKYENR